VRKTSTGCRRTLAAGLCLLNCPQPCPHQEQRQEQRPPPGPADLHPKPQPLTYDLSHHARDPRMVTPWTFCEEIEREREAAGVGCVSKGQLHTERRK